MATLEVLKTRLDEAEEALHRVSIGERDVKVSVGGFGFVEFSQVNIEDLRRYITHLQDRIAAKELRKRRRLLHITF